VVTVRNNNCTGEIHSLTYQGLLTIEFNTTMHTLFNHSWLNDTIVDIYVSPSEERMSEEDFDISKFNLTFNVSNYQNNILDI